MLAKTVHVHDDTHTALKRLKAQRRVSSLDEVIRAAIKDSLGTTVEGVVDKGKTEQLTSYAEE